MKVVVAMDSFKGSLSAHKACEVVKKAISERLPSVDVVIKPMADGGKGTAWALMEAANGCWIAQTVMGPLPDMQVEAGFAWFNENKTALIEMASASGLELLSKQKMNPLRTTTYGTGQLIRATLSYKPEKILIALGDSATVDGGVGAAMALGWKFVDTADNPVPLGGGGLKKIRKIIEPQNLDLPPIEVLCDVDNPLCGEQGAARIYGPQKGATGEMVEELEAGLIHFAEVIQQQLKCDICGLPGAGAAGGLAAGAVIFMNGLLVSGIDVIMSMSNIYAEIESSDWVITGEGSFDSQSLRGKVVSGILKASQKSKANVAVIAGQVTMSESEYQKSGVVTAVPCRTKDMSLDYAIENCETLLYNAAKRFAQEYLLSR